MDEYAVETLRWRNNHLQLIDQRLLPDRVEYRACHSAADTAECIRTMVVRGAPAIGCAAAYGLALEAQRLRHASPAEVDQGLDMANKIGTYMVAVLDRRHGIPFYVACPLSTIDMNTAHGRDIAIEERAPEEVLGFGENRWAAEGVAVRNPAFDVTPAELVTALITERDVVSEPDGQKLEKLFHPSGTRTDP